MEDPTYHFSYSALLAEAKRASEPLGISRMLNKRTIQNIGDKELLFIKASGAHNRAFSFPCNVHISIRTKDDIGNEASGTVSIGCIELSHIQCGAVRAVATWGSKKHKK